MKVNVVERKQRSGLITFYLDYSLNGKRNREKLSLGRLQPRTREYTQAKNEASKIAALRSAQLLEGEYNLPKKASKLGLHDYIDGFAQSYRGKDNRKVNAMLRHLLAFSENVPLDQIDVDFCQDFADYLRKHLSVEASRNYFALFKQALDKAARKNMVRTNPARDAKVNTKGYSEAVMRKDVLSIDELRILADTHCGNETIKDAFLFACNTGITLSELKTLNIHQLQSDRLSYTRPTIR